MIDLIFCQYDVVDRRARDHPAMEDKIKHSLTVRQTFK